jgi:hypothetical protein
MMPIEKKDGSVGYVLSEHEKAIIDEAVRVCLLEWIYPGRKKPERVEKVASYSELMKSFKEAKK